MSTSSNDPTPQWGNPAASAAYQPTQAGYPTPPMPSHPSQPPGYPVASNVVNRIGKTRNPWGVWLLTLITFGIYGLWWYYTVNRELRDFDPQINVQPGLSLCALIFGGFTFGIATIVSIAKTGARIGQAQRYVGSRENCSSVVGLLLWLIGFGVVYYQSQLNKVWDAYGNPEPGTVRP